MKWENSVEKRWILKLILNFEGGSSDTADRYFLYEDDFDTVITITDC